MDMNTQLINEGEMMIEKQTELVLEKDTTVIQLVDPCNESSASLSSTAENQLKSKTKSDGKSFRGPMKHLSFVLILGFIFGIPLVQIIIGILYQEQCPINNSIPEYLIGAGIIGIPLGILSLYQNDRCRGLPCLCLQGLLAVLNLAWFISGNAYVFKAWPLVRFKEPTHRSSYCHGVPTIHPDARWARNGITIAGGHGLGKALNQLYLPDGLIVDDDGIVYIADWCNDRIMKWTQNDIEGHIVIGENRNELKELFKPSDLVIDKEQNCFIISDNGKRRVIRLAYKDTSNSVEAIVDNILCWGLTIDDEGSLYITDLEKHEVRCYRRGEKMTTGTIVAGGNGQGKLENQLNTPLYVFVDSEQAIYVSDYENHRVMKWMKGATDGVLVAGGQYAGEDLAHLWCPCGIIVDKEGIIYVADSQNHRVMRWRKGAHQGELIIGGHGQGENAYQLNEPKGLSFDNSGNLYVTDKNNHRVQLFSIR